MKHTWLNSNTFVIETTERHTFSSIYKIATSIDPASDRYSVIGNNIYIKIAKESETDFWRDMPGIDQINPDSILHILLPYAKDLSNYNPLHKKYKVPRLDPKAIKDNLEEILFKYYGDISENSKIKLLTELNEKINQIYEINIKYTQLLQEGILSNMRNELLPYAQYAQKFQEIENPPEHVLKEDAKDLNDIKPYDKDYVEYSYIQELLGNEDEDHQRSTKKFLYSFPNPDKVLILDENKNPTHSTVLDMIHALDTKVSLDQRLDELK